MSHRPRNSKVSQGYEVKRQVNREGHEWQSCHNCLRLIVALATEGTIFSAACSTAIARRNRFFLIAAILVLAIFSSAQAQIPNAELPAGAMQAKATSACLECHEARIILQQRLSKAAWTKEVDKMTKWGATYDPADRDALIDYLSANFPPDKPSFEAPRTAGDKSRPAAKR
jgi:hypothetical protein